MIITGKAFKALAMINASCRTFEPKKEENLRYLTACAKAAGDSSDFGQFLSGLPEKSFMYPAIAALAQIRKEEAIGLEFIYRYFSGADHVDFTLDQIKATEMVASQGQLFADRYLFAHLLVPAKISATGDGLEAVYVNGPVAVRIRNLIVHPWMGGGVSIGQTVLVHYAMIVGTCTPALEQQLLEDQAQSPEFIAAADRIGEIDMKQFFGLYEWTKSILERCGA